MPAEYTIINRRVFDGYEDNLSGVSAFTVGVAKAEFTNVSKTVLVKEAEIVEIIVPAQFETITCQLVAKGASVKESTVPAMYETVSRQVVDKVASVREIEIPAV